MAHKPQSCCYGSVGWCYQWDVDRAQSPVMRFGSRLPRIKCLIIRSGWSWAAWMWLGSLYRKWRGHCLRVIQEIQYFTVWDEENPEVSHGDCIFWGHWRTQIKTPKSRHRDTNTIRRAGDKKHPFLLDFLITLKDKSNALSKCWRQTDTASDEHWSWFLKDHYCPNDFHQCSSFVSVSLMGGWQSCLYQ